MRFPLILKDKLIVYPFLLSLLFLAFSLGFTYFNLKDMSNILVIHYDAFKGVDFFGTKADVFAILGIGTVFAGLNMFLAKVLYLKERFLAYLLSFFTAVFGLLIFIGVLAIISVN